MSHLKAIPAWLASLPAILGTPHAHADERSPLDTWQWRNPLPQGISLETLTYGNGRFLAAGIAGAVITSLDGTNWILSETGTNVSFVSAAAGNGAFVLGSGGRRGTFVSTDLTNWSALPTNLTLGPIVFAKGMFMAADGSTNLWHSLNGRDWGARNQCVSVHERHVRMVDSSDQPHRVLPGVARVLN